MEAVAHNPAFAKKAGVPQSVGKDYSAADKGKKFSGGGRTALQKLNKQDTQHGAMDMPFKSLKKFGGMKSGGSVKKYAEGGDLERLGEPQNFKDAFKEARGEGASTFTWRGKKYSTAFAPSKDMSAKSETRSMKPVPSGETNAGAVTGRTLPMKDKSLAIRALQEDMNIGRENERRMDAEENKNPDVQRVLGTRIGKTFKQGGSVKKSMGMHKMADGMMMKNSAMRGMAPGMKKGGMPMKDGKPAFMMGKKMMGGGMAKYAKGGSVSARADGIAIKGKTKGKMV